MSRDSSGSSSWNKSSYIMIEHVTELYQVTLLLRKVTDAMGALGISGDLNNEVNKYYPVLCFNHKPHGPTHNCCRKTMREKTCFMEKQ